MQMFGILKHIQLGGKSYDNNPPHTANHPLRPCGLLSGRL
jgi:hypothetical protein